MTPLDKDGILFFQLPFPDTTRLSHAFFTRHGGVSPAPYASLNVAPLSADAPAYLRENLRRIASVLPADPAAVVAARQVHGNRVIRVSETNIACSIFSAVEPFQGDALITDREGVWLAILTADCLPVLFFDPCKRVIAAAHAGWRGTLQHITADTLAEMTRLYGCRPKDVLAALGPAIGPCCYEVGDDVARLFSAPVRAGEPFARRNPAGRWTLDLAGLNRLQLLDSGVGEERILQVPVCTRCRGDLFFSVRGQREPTGRQLSVIGLPPSE